MSFRSSLLNGLTILLAVSFPLQVFSASKRPVTPSQQWSGSVADLSLSEAVPEVIITEKDLENLWAVWKVPDLVPKVDFSRELVAVLTTQGSKMRLSATLDEIGNLEALGLATRDLRPGFRYVIAVLSREGVKTVNGKELADKTEKASSRTSSAQDRSDFAASGVEVQSVKTMDIKEINAAVSKAAGKGETWPKDAILVALKFIGSGLKGSTKIIDVRTPPEQSDMATITVTESGYLDDAIGGERWRLWLERGADGIWIIKRALWAQLCDRTGHRFYSAEKCP